MMEEQADVRSPSMGSRVQHLDSVALELHTHSHPHPQTHSLLLKVCTVLLMGERNRSGLVTENTPNPPPNHKTNLA